VEGTVHRNERRKVTAVVIDLLEGSLKVERDVGVSFESGTALRQPVADGQGYRWDRLRYGQRLTQIR
jgi:hypothetical protein